jgi:flagellar hook-length control protein FliK
LSPKLKGKSSAAAQLAVANEATADAALTSPEADAVVEPTKTASASAHADAAEGESTTKQALVEQSIDGVGTTQAATDEPNDDEAAKKSADTGRTRNGSRDIAKSGLESGATSEADVNRARKNVDTTSAEAPATVVAASASAGEQSQELQTGSFTASKSDKASAKSRSTSDEKLPGSQQVTADSVGSQSSVGTAARGDSVPSAPVAAAIASTTTARDFTPETTPSDSAQPKKVGAAKEGVLATFARFDRGGLLGGRGAQRAGEAQDGPHVDPARFVNRVARAIQTAHERGTPLLLRLSPPELGSLRLELSVQQGALSATVEADNQNARQILLDNLPALRDRLADQNIRIERFDVDVRRDGEGRQQPNANAQQQQEQQQGGSSHHQNTHRGIASDAAVDPVTIVQTSITNTSINVVA